MIAPHSQTHHCRRPGVVYRTPAMPGFPPSPIRKIPCLWTNGRTKEGSRCLRIASSGLAPIAHRAVEHRGASTDNRGDSLQRTSTFSLPTRTTLTHRAGARCRHDTEEAAIRKSNIFFFHNCGLAPVPATQPHGAASQEPILDVTPRTPSQHGARVPVATTEGATAGPDKHEPGAGDRAGNLEVQVWCRPLSSYLLP